MMEMIRFGVMGLEEYDAVIYLDSDVHVSEFYWYFLYWMQLDSHSELRMGVTRVHNWRRDCHVWLEFGPLSGACVCSCGGDGIVICPATNYCTANHQLQSPHAA
jgi:hypothetical protein